MLTDSNEQNIYRPNQLENIQLSTDLYIPVHALLGLFSKELLTKN